MQQRTVPRMRWWSTHRSPTGSPTASAANVGLCFALYLVMTVLRWATGRGNNSSTDCATAAWPRGSREEPDSTPTPDSVEMIANALALCQFMALPDKTQEEDPLLFGETEKEDGRAEKPLFFAKLAKKLRSGGHGWFGGGRCFSDASRVAVYASGGRPWNFQELAWRC
ncbi:hypothetical protein NL676_029036 [Syzygium grande]|nr:hypothetical protein NL676_029036 [Syzygium grande]